MSVEELQKYTVISKYARWVKEKNRREVWPETVERYKGMLQEKYPERTALIEETCREIEAFRVMPSMRGLQFAGKPILQHNGRLYNCTSSFCDRLRFFAEGFYLLLCGSGVGFSVQQRHIQHLPCFSKKRIKGIELPTKTFVVPDSIEGWADTSNVLLSSFFERPVKGFEEYHDCEVVLDTSHVRRKNSLLSFGIGKAPGPTPLRKAFERNHRLLTRAMEEGLEKLNSIYAYDLFMHWADAVISGGVRRSATICIFDLCDELMLHAKTGNWMHKHPHRARSNNSVRLIRGKVSFSLYQKLFEVIHQFGEPGISWADHEDDVPNPCHELSMNPSLSVREEKGLRRLLKHYDGPVIKGDDEIRLSGFQMCNLTTIPAKDIADADDFYERCRHAALLGTWQAGFNHFPYLGEVTDLIVQREALLGVSIAGIMHHPSLLLDPTVLRQGVSVIRQANDGEAREIGINPAARLTTIKPDGNSASALGSFSGCHAGKFHEGFRIVQANRMEAPYQHFRSVNPQACEPSAWSANDTDDVIRFCVQYEGKMEEDMTAVEFLDHVKTLYQHWIEPGKVLSRCSKPWLCNNVSNTVRVRPHEWDGVAEHIFKHQDAYGGVSLIGSHGDRDYAQAPFTGVHNPEAQKAAYGEAAQSALELAQRGMAAFGNLWTACDVFLGHKEAEDLSSDQQEWLADCHSFSGLLQNDKKRAIYCLKDSFNWDLYCRLKSSYTPVDYTQMVEEDNGVQFSATVACAGGVCEL